MELRPNCLLTRYPLCFIHGLKNFFAAKNYWGGIPHYLKEHGYDVYEFNGPWRGPHAARIESFAAQLRPVLKKFEKAHIISHSLGALDSLDLISLPEFKNRIASVTLISPPFAGTPLAQLGLLFGKKLFVHTNETLTAEGAKAIVERFSPDPSVLVGSIITRPHPNEISWILRVQSQILKLHLKRNNMPLENDGLVPLYSQYVAKSLGTVFLEYQGDHMQVVGRGKKPQSEKLAHHMYLDHAIFLAEFDFKTAQ